MTPFLNVTLEGDDEGGPFLVNPAHIVCVRRGIKLVTIIELSNGSSVAVAESMIDIMQMLDARGAPMKEYS